MHIPDRLFLCRFLICPALLSIMAHIAFPMVLILTLSWTDQTFLIKSDQICPSCFYQCLIDKIVILRIPVLDQRSLHRFLMGICWHIDLLHGPGVKAGVVHDGGQGRGGGVEVLHLLRIVAHIPDVLRQLHGLLHGRAGMAGHEIGHQELIHIVLLVQSKIFVHKPIVYRVPGLAHAAEHRIGHVLRGDLQLPGDVVLHQLPEEGVLGVGQKIVKANAAANEDLLDPGNFPELAQQRHIIAVVGVHILAGGGVEALPSAAGTLGHLLFAGRVPEVGGGAAHIVDVALEVRIFDHFFCLGQNGFVASHLDDTALVEGQGAEGAGAEAAPVGYQTEFDFLNGGDAPRLFIAGVIGTHVGKVVHRIHFGCGQGLLGRVLHHIFLPVGLGQPLGGERITVAVLDFEGLGVGALAFLQLLVAGQNNRGQAFVQLPALKDRAVDIGDVLHVHTGVQGVRNFHDAALTHAVHQQVRLGIQEDGTLHGIGPVVVVGQAAQAGLNAANENGHILVGLPDEIAVDDGGVVRALAHDAAGSEGVRLPAVPGDGIVVDHGVHVAAADQKAQPGATEDVDGLGVAPVRLRDDDHAVAVAFQNAADDGVAKGRVVYVGVANDVDKVRLRNAALQHFLLGDG